MDSPTNTEMQAFSLASRQRKRAAAREQAAMKKQDFIDHPGFSQSSLKQYADPKSRSLFVARKIHGRTIESKPSASMIFGSRVEAYLFTPGRVQNCPSELLNAKGERATTGKAWKEFADNGKLIDTSGYCHQGGVWYITPREREQLDLVTEGVKRHPRISRMLSGGFGPVEWHRRELWTQNGLQRKAELDIWLPDPKFVWEIKTAAAIDHKTFTDDCYKWGYHIQLEDYANAILMATGETVDAVGAIVIKNCEPYDCELYEIDEGTRYEASMFLDRWTGRLKVAIDAGDWGPQTAKTTGMISRPHGWAGSRWDDERLLGDI